MNEIRDQSAFISSRGAGNLIAAGIMGCQHYLPIPPEIYSSEISFF